MTQAVILAGGKGTRLAGRLGSLPKPLVKLAGKPLLEHQIEHLARFGIREVVLLVNHGAESIADFIARWRAEGITSRLIDDGEPRGTAGAVFAALDQLTDRFLVLYGDTLVNVNLTAFLNTHERSGADATLFLHPNDHPQDSDIVETDAEGWVNRFHPYPHEPDTDLPNLVNAALYVLEKRALMPYRHMAQPCDFGKNVFPAMLTSGATLFGYSSFEYIKDVGTPARLDKVEADLRSGVVARASLSVPQKAVFVDRDGTLNIFRGLITKPREIDLLPGVAKGIRKLHDNEFRVVVVTNQPVIARGDVTIEELKQIHARLETLLGMEGAYLDAIYFCPHHPDSGFPGEIAALKIDCECRKPKTALIDRAVKAMTVEVGRSWMIGDGWRDMEMAQRAGLRSVLLAEDGAANCPDARAKANHVARNFAEAVEIILSQPETRI